MTIHKLQADILRKILPVDITLFRFSQWNRQGVFNLHKQVLYSLLLIARIKIGLIIEIAKCETFLKISGTIPDDCVTRPSLHREMRGLYSQ